MPDHETDWLLPGARRDTQSAERDPRAAIPLPLDGVLYRAFTPVRTGYGSLREMLRSEWLDDNAVVDQVFVSTLAPGAVSAWHAHDRCTDRLFVISGILRVVLYDKRLTSSTRGRLHEVELSGETPGLLVIPPRVWHGIKNVGTVPVHVANAVDIAYHYESPDHWRVPPDSPEIPYRLVD